MANQTLADFTPLTQERIEDFFEIVYAPWVKDMGLTDFEIGRGYCRCRVPQAAHIQFFSGWICGQAMMAAVDTVASIASMTGDKPSRGTVYQHTHFMKPAAAQDLLAEARVRKFGKERALIDCTLKLAESGDECAFAVLEFAY